MEKILNNHLRSLTRDCKDYFGGREGDSYFFESHAHRNYLEIEYNNNFTLGDLSLGIEVWLDREADGFFFDTRYKSYDDKYKSYEDLTIDQDYVPISVIEDEMQKKHPLSSVGPGKDKRGLYALRTYFKTMLTQLHQQKNSTKKNVL